VPTPPSKVRVGLIIQLLLEKKGKFYLGIALHWSGFPGDVYGGGRAISGVVERHRSLSWVEIIPPCSCLISCSSPFSSSQHESWQLDHSRASCVCGQTDTNGSQVSWITPTEHFWHKTTELWPWPVS
jgi:hypothetical protein